MLVKKKITAFIIVLCSSVLTLLGQSNITRAEYFFNKDPGFGLANPVTGLTPGVDIQDFHAPITISGLPSGLNTLFIRSANANNVWSVTNWLLFLKAPLLPAPNINAAEYFIDTDTGFSKGSRIVISPNSDVSDVPVPVDISTEKPGLHTLFLRSRDANGKWSITNSFLFLKTILPSQSYIVGAEYFIDKDPGFGKADSIHITSTSDMAVPIDITSASQGLHTLFLRSKDVNGKWSITNSYWFYKTSNTLYDVVEAEYFIDKDPGFGNASEVPSFLPSVNNSNDSFSINLTAIDTGRHELFLRTKNAIGKWSITNYVQFYKTGNVPVTWLSFDAIPLQDEVLLQWKTATEENSSYFQVEFSTDGNNFSTIGNVAAAGNSSLERSYSFTHTSPLKKQANFYRIKQFDKDGKFTYSPIRTAKLDGTADFVALPNPVRNSLTINTSQTDLTIDVFESDGRKVLMQKISNYSTVLNFSRLANGIYYLVAERNGKVLYTKKVLKQ